jgi:hypothetical protein
MPDYEPNELFQGVTVGGPDRGGGFNVEEEPGMAFPLGPRGIQQDPLKKRRRGTYSDQDMLDLARPPAKPNEQ